MLSCFFSALSLVTKLPIIANLLFFFADSKYFLHKAHFFLLSIFLWCMVYSKNIPTLQISFFLLCLHVHIYIYKDNVHITIHDDCLVSSLLNFFLFPSSSSHNAWKNSRHSPNLSHSNETFLCPQLPSIRLESGLLLLL